MYVYIPPAHPTKKSCNSDYNFLKIYMYMYSVGRLTPLSNYTCTCTCTCIPYSRKLYRVKTFTNRRKYRENVRGFPIRSMGWALLHGNSQIKLSWKEAILRNSFTCKSFRLYSMYYAASAVRELSNETMLRVRQFPYCTSEGVLTGL